MTPAAEPTAVTDRWVEDAAALRKFWAWSAQQGLGKDDVHEALGVDSVLLFDGDKKAAMDKITAWIAAHTAAPEAQEG